MQPFDDAFRSSAEKSYGDLVRTRYEPALGYLRLALEDLLDKEFDPTDRARLRVEPGNIKQFNRLFRKAQADEHSPRITEPEDIFREIPDIVRTRITCNVASDVRRVSESILKVERTKAGRKKSRPSFRICKYLPPRDYIETPKPSGYRGYHIFVEIDVPSGGELQAVVCEVQVRTLLQHAWGELTHEDTYKPGMVVPEIVVSLSKRLATALAVMDEIAQDIRVELDRITAPLNDGDTLQEPPFTQLAEVGSGKPVAPLPFESTEVAATYSVGSRHLGEVIYVGWDYALIQLAPGATGILHWTKLGRTPTSGYIDVREHVKLGSTIDVTVVGADPSKSRIELAIEPALENAE